MRAALPGTKHSTVLDRRELAIVEAIVHTAGVKKLEPSRITWTGPSPLRLRLRAGIFSGVLEAWLYIGCGKRLHLLCPEPGMKIEELAQNLAAALSRFGIKVEITNGGVPMYEEHESNQSDSHQPVLTLEEKWAWCEMVYEGVKKAKEMEEEERMLEMQLEEKRSQRKRAQAETFEYLNHALEVRPMEKAAA